MAQHTRKPFYITPCRQKDFASLENYASELHQVMILRGSDILRTDGLPWSRPHYALSKYYLPLYEKLKEERLVSADLDRVLLTLPAARLIYSRSHILYTLNDTFILDFSILKPSFFVITEQGVESLIVDFRGMYRESCTLYTGAYTNHRLSILLCIDYL